MKLMRVGAPGAEKPAILAADGTIRDLSGVVKDISGDVLTPAGLDKLRAVDTSKLPVLDKGQRIGPCVGSVGKFIAIGLNYADHAAETNSPIPSEPITFMKPSVSPFSLARPTRVIVRVPISSLRPALRASVSVMPARPCGGSMYSAEGGRRALPLRGSCARARLARPRLRR